MNLSKTEIDLGFCLSRNISKLRNSDLSKISETNINKITMTVLKKGDDVFHVSLSYNEVETGMNLKSSDVATPRAWETVLEHRPRVRKFLKNVTFINRSGDADYILPFGHTREFGIYSPVENTWSDVLLRLDRAMAAAKLVMQAFNKHNDTKRDVILAWVTPTAALQWKPGSTKMVLVRFNAGGFSPTHLIFNTPNTDEWEWCFTDRFLEWLSTDEWERFPTMFMTRVYWISGFFEHSRSFEKQLCKRFKDITGMSIPEWTVVCNSTRPDVIGFATGRYESDVAFLPLSPNYNHAPIFCQDDARKYVEDYAQTVWRL